MEGIYIDKTISLWGGQNGELFIETENNGVICWNVQTLLDDLPSIIKIAMEEKKIDDKDKLERLKNIIKKL